MQRHIAAFALLLVLGTFVSAQRRQGSTVSVTSAPQTTQVNHVFWIWFENREISAVTTPTFVNFASTYANFTNFFGIEHPSQPNYLDAFSGSNHGITNDNHFTIIANGNDNLGKQLFAAGKSWRIYEQDYPGSCSDADTFAGGVDGAGVSGTYVRKHNPAISFESIRLDPTQCAFVQPLANFDPSVNFAMIVPNLINDMHDGTTTQGDNFLAAFLPQITGSADWAHTLVFITFDEGTTNNGGGGNIYMAAGAPWLSHVSNATTYNHFSVLRTTEQIFGLSFLGGAATATTMNEVLPVITTAANISVSGRVLMSDGIGVRNARVTLRDPNGTLHSAVTNAFGYYRFNGLASGGNYVVSVDARGARYTPRLVAATDQLTDINFIPD